jgi:glucose-6-phosphate dehydrogenase assembly protein OpcA
MPAVQVEKLLGDLAQVWLDLGKQQEEGGVMRACAMTLIALVEETPGAGSGVSETVAGIMQDYPSRAIVVRIDGASGEIDAHASAFCWKPFGRRQQICCEQIDFRANRARLADIPSLLRGLTVANLPVVLWVRSPGLVELDGFLEVAELADKVIVESRGERDWRRLASQVRALLDSGKAAADLAWTRITRWRELIAQLFENESLAERSAGIRTVTVSHSSPEPGPAATYLATWLQLALGGAPEIRYRESPREVTWQIQEVRLEGPGIDVHLHRAERGIVEIRARSLKTCAMFRQLREADLLREELSILGPDPTFVKVLRAL